MTEHVSSQELRMSSECAPRPVAVRVACPHCRAPAVFHSIRTDPAGSIRDGWPGCWVQAGDDREGEPVGELCPNCGSVRPGDVPSDEWRRTHPVQQGAA